MSPKAAMIASVALFIAVMLALKYLVMPPFVASFGIVGVILFIGAMLLIAFYIEGRDKKKQHEAEQVALRAQAEALRQQIHDEMGKPKRPDIIDVEFTVIDPEQAPKPQSQSRSDTTTSESRGLVLNGTAIAAVVMVIAIIIGLLSMPPRSAAPDNTYELLRGLTEGDINRKSR